MFDRRHGTNRGRGDSITTDRRHGTSRRSGDSITIIPSAPYTEPPVRVRSRFITSGNRGQTGISAQVMIPAAQGTGHLWGGNWLISSEMIFDSWRAGNRERDERAKGARYPFLIATCGESL